MLKEEHLAIALQDASGLADGGAGVPERAKAKDDHDCVELLIAEWQRFGASLNQANWEAHVVCSTACPHQHVGVRIDAHDLVSVGIERQAQARANAEVQNPADCILADPCPLSSDAEQLERHGEHVIHRRPSRVFSVHGLDVRLLYRRCCLSHGCSSCIVATRCSWNSM